MGTVLLGMLVGGCSGGNRHFWRDNRNRLIVAGPMIGPYDSLTDLSPDLCEKVMEFPGARAGHDRPGQEYCGAVYQRNFEAPFYASFPSNSSSPVPIAGRKKNCDPVDGVQDAAATRINIYADYHSPPGKTMFSEDDLKLKNQPYYVRVQFNPYCEVYLYEVQTRTVFQLRDGRFVQVKKVAHDDLGF
ncbi:hypothetical protein NVS55_04155 [Myxococcus stipitatus]|uniref:hypothetical protein n=1 Tax=Myxococcus stipitatus TaxID=83455 RepID=UPI003144F322